MTKFERLTKLAVDELNKTPVVDKQNLKALHGSKAAKNHFSEGLFRTADGKRYVVDPTGAIRRTDRVKIIDEVKPDAQ